MQTKHVFGCGGSERSREILRIAGIACAALFALSTGSAWCLEEVPQCAPQDKACRAKAEAVRARNNRERVYEPLDASTVTEVPVKCSSGAALLGALPCEDKQGQPGFYSSVESELKAYMGKRNGDYYQGTRTNVLAGIGGLSGLPVCNITSGEGEGLSDIQDTDDRFTRIRKNHNWLPVTNGASYCGEPYGMKLDTGLFSGTMHFDDQNGHGDYEYGQYRGAMIQVQNYYKEKVIAQFRQGVLKLVSIEGARACQEAAADVIREQKALESFTHDVVNLTGGAEKAAKLKCDPSMIGNDPVANAQCVGPKANMHLRAAWAGLLDCEVFWRAASDFEENFGNQERFVSDIKNHMKPKCKEAASCKRNGSKQCSGLFCCGDGLRTKLWNQCYRREIPKFLKSKLEKYKTTTPVELPRGPKKSNQTSSNDVVGGWALALGSLGGFRRRRQDKKNTAPNWLRTVRSLAVVALVAVLGAGCSCDDNNAQCQPCRNPQQQSAGCLYKACLKALYYCTTVFDGGRIDQSVRADRHDDDTDCYTPEGGEVLPMLMAFQGGPCPYHNGDKKECQGNTGMPGPSGAPQCGTFLDEAAQTMREAGAGIEQERHERNKGAPDSMLGGGKGLANAMKLSDEWRKFAAAHKLKRESLEKARNKCRRVAGIDASHPGSDDYSKAGSDMNIGAAGGKDEVEAFKKVLFDMMAKDTGGMGGAMGPDGVKTGDSNDPTCTHLDVNGGNSGGFGGDHSNGLASDLADSRQQFGGNALAAEKDPSKKDSAKGGGAATAANKNAAFGDKPGSGKSGAGGGLDMPLAPTLSGAGGAGPGAGNEAPKSLGASNVGAASVEGGSEGAAGASDVVGQPTGFETVAGAGAGRGAAKPAGVGFDAGAAAGANGAVSFNNGNAVEGSAGVTEEGILRDSKLSLFEIVNKRTEKFSNSL